MTRIYTHTFANGLKLIGEHMPDVRSVSMSMLLPAGVSAEPATKQGVASILAEIVARGAGGLDARQHSDALDMLGVDRSTAVHTSNLRISASMLPHNLNSALPLLLDMAKSPSLDEHQLEPCRDLAIQAIQSLEDDPQGKVIDLLNSQHLPDPLGRSTLGKVQDIMWLTHDDLLAFAKRTLVPGDSILAFAGCIDWPQLVELVGSHIEAWQGSYADDVKHLPAPRGYMHEPQDSSQMHIALACDGPADPHADSMLQRAAISVLSGGMSGRLFTEVREKRGLCYSVYASYVARRELGIVYAYAGTTPPRAQQTYDVMLEQLRLMSKGVQPDEFARAIVGMKARLVMSGESTGARAGTLATDQYVRGEPRSLESLRQRVEAITLADLNDYLARQSMGDLTTVSIGPAPLALASEVA